MAIFSMRVTDKAKDTVVSFCRTGGISMRIFMDDIVKMIENGDLAVEEREVVLSGAYKDFITAAKERGADPAKILEQVTRQLQNPPRNKKGET